MTSDRRAYQRFLLNSAIEITGVEESRLQFVERTHVENVGDSGCCFTIRSDVHRGDILGVEPLGPDGEKLAEDYPRLFLIIWVKRKGDRVTVGVRCLMGDELTDVCAHPNFSNSKIPPK
jgi:hypothetical protein